MPDADSRLEILKVHTHNRPVEKELDLAWLAEQTEGLTGADLESLCNRATLPAIREFLAQEIEIRDREGEDGGGLCLKSLSALVIRAHHFQKALEEMLPP